MTDKNILIISKYAVAPKYGYATRQFYIAKHMVKLGHNVSLISSQSSQVTQYEKIQKYYRQDEIAGVSCFLLKGKKIALGFSLKRIISWVLFEWRILKLCLWSKRISRPDYIIVSSLSILTFLTGVFLKRKYKCSLIVEVRDIWPLTLVDIGGYSEKNLFVKALAWIEKFGYKNANAIVGTMPNLKEHIYTTYPKLRHKKVYCIPQGYDPDDLKDLSKFSNTYLNNLSRIDKSTFNFIYAGTLGKVNRIDIMMNLCEKLIHHKEIKFYVLGDGPLLDDIRKFALTHTNIVVLDRLAKREVYPFLSYFDLQFTIVRNLPIYRYGVSSNKFIDYMWNAPFLYSYEGYDSLIEGEKYSFCVPFDENTILNKILEISKMPKEELMKMREQGRKILQANHNFQTLASKYYDILKES